MYIDLLSIYSRQYQHIVPFIHSLANITNIQLEYDHTGKELVKCMTHSYESLKREVTDVVSIDILRCI